MLVETLNPAQSINACVFHSVEQSWAVDAVFGNQNAAKTVTEKISEVVEVMIIAVVVF